MIYIIKYNLNIKFKYVIMFVNVVFKVLRIFLDFVGEIFFYEIMIKFFFKYYVLIMFYLLIK